MQIWLDTIDLEVISAAEKMGIIAGITTNPSILSKSKNVHETLHQILLLQKGPVAVQVTSQDSEEMVKEGKAIYRFSNRTIVKVPVNNPGLIAIKQLRKEKIPVMATIVLTPIQALLAANAEVNYISPYLSHLASPLEQLKIILALLRANQSKTKVLVASVKQLDHFIHCAQLGVEAATIKKELFHLLCEETGQAEKYVEKFSKEWSLSFGEESISDLLLSDPVYALLQ